MNINIKATNMKLTDEVEEYIQKRILTVEKFIQKEGAHINVEVGKTTNHHKQGDVFKAEIEILSDGHTFFAMAETDDVYKAIDEAKEEIVRELTSTKDRNHSLFRRGARSVKKMLKGLSSRNPDTSKYGKEF
jgi:ribosomal subunit interface protein